MFITFTNCGLFMNNVQDIEKFRSLINHIPGVLYRCAGDEWLSLEFFSDEISNLTGYAPDYFTGNRKDGYAGIIYEADREMVTHSIQQAVTINEKFEIEYRIVKKDGEVRWVLETGQGVYDESAHTSYVDGCIFDITHRKKTEAALKKSEDEVKRLALVAHNTTNSVLITDVEQNITWVNEGFTRITGYSLEDIRGKKLGYSLEGPEMDIDNQKRIRYALDHKLPFNEEFVSYARNGEPIWLKVDCHPLFDEHGEHLGFMAIENDITRRKMAQKVQEELLQRLTLATGSAEIGIWEIDLSTNQVIWDEQMYAIYGYSSTTSESLYKIFYTSVHPDDMKLMSDIITELLSFKKEINGAVYRIIVPDGHIKYIESHAIIKKSESGKIISLIGTNRDITEDILGQEKIKAQNKVLREIAFIQSHEVRRPLANILGMIEILKNSGALNDLEIFNHLVESANELDREIRNIVNKTNNLDDAAFR